MPVYLPTHDGAPVRIGGRRAACHFSSSDPQTRPPAQVAVGSKRKPDGAVSPHGHETPPADANNAVVNPTFATRGIEAAKLEVFCGVRSKGRHHTGRCHGTATSTEAILGDG